MATRVELLGTEIECEGSCLEEVKNLTQSLVLVNLAIGNVVETLLPYMQFKAAQKMREEEAQDVYHSQHEIQASMPQYEGTFEDYNEIVIQVHLLATTTHQCIALPFKLAELLLDISALDTTEHCCGLVQFATVTVFALAYPLGALLALFNNMIEIRSDAFKLVQVPQVALLQTQSLSNHWAGHSTAICKEGARHRLVVWDSETYRHSCHAEQLCTCWLHFQRVLQ